jgi:hypothetical protein
MGHCTQALPLRAGSFNVRLGGILQGAPAGTWCFSFEEGIEPSTAIVIASAEGAMTTSSHNAHPVFDSAQWVAEAPNCEPNQIEVQTVRYTDDGTGLVAEHASDIPFSFVIP